VSACPVCGKGERAAAPGHNIARHVSHLACVGQANHTMRVAVDALFDAQTALTSAEKVLLEQRAELAALKGQTCGTCVKWTTDACPVGWQEYVGGDYIPNGDHDDYCPYWTARSEEGTP
jgi:hypothetical protein